MIVPQLISWRYPLLLLLCLGIIARVFANPSRLIEEIVQRRDISRTIAKENVGSEGCGFGERASFLRPRDDGNNFPVCEGQGILLRRDMGSLGVSSFQQVYGAIAADALGPAYKYYDEWPAAAGLLKPGVQYEASEAEKLISKSSFVALKPHMQDELSTLPWNMTDEGSQQWIQQLRKEVCQGDASDTVKGARVQGHFQHIGFFRRYRSYIQKCILRSPDDFRTSYFRPAVFSPNGDSRKYEKELSPNTPVADLVVYLRLGDKSVAGDTLLTFNSGYYQAVLKERRPHHKVCWIVTGSLGDRRAIKLAEDFDCLLQGVTNYYSDWTAMYLAPTTLVMAASTYIYFQALVGLAKEVHYPAVGFFHDKHNVCMRERKEDSHFGQIRLPFGLVGDDEVHPQEGGAGSKKIYYHDIYSKQFFLTYEDLAAQAKALPCSAILDQHVCQDTSKPDNYRESRYCYRRANEETNAAAQSAQELAVKVGDRARQVSQRHHQRRQQQKKRKSTGPRLR